MNDRFRLILPGILSSTILLAGVPNSTAQQTGPLFTRKKKAQPARAPVQTDAQAGADPTAPNVGQAGPVNASSAISAKKKPSLVKRNLLHPDQEYNRWKLSQLSALQQQHAQNDGDIQSQLKPSSSRYQTELAAWKQQADQQKAPFQNDLNALKKNGVANCLSQHAGWSSQDCKVLVGAQEHTDNRHLQTLNGQFSPQKFNANYHKEIDAQLKAENSRYSAQVSQWKSDNPNPEQRLAADQKAQLQGLKDLHSRNLADIQDQLKPSNDRYQKELAAWQLQHADAAKPLLDNLTALKQTGVSNCLAAHAGWSSQDCKVLVSAEERTDTQHINALNRQFSAQNFSNGYHKEINGEIKTEDARYKDQVAQWKSSHPDPLLQAQADAQSQAQALRQEHASNIAAINKERSPKSAQYQAALAAWDDERNAKQKPLQDDLAQLQKSGVSDCLARGAGWTQQDCQSLVRTEESLDKKEISTLGQQYSSANFSAQYSRGLNQAASAENARYQQAMKTFASPAEQHKKDVALWRQQCGDLTTAAERTSCNKEVDSQDQWFTQQQGTTRPHSPAGGGRIFVPTTNAFEPYRQVSSCPPGTKPVVTDWPNPGDRTCRSS